LVSLTLPAGNYLVFAQLQAGSANGSSFPLAEVVECRLVAGGSIIGGATSDRDAVIVNLTPVAKAELPAGGQVTFECYTYERFSIRADFAMLIAIKVNTIH
jgi:hypothetical protein